MGFFQDLKEDLSQAVNELMPDEALDNAEEGGISTESVQEEEAADESANEITSGDLADMLDALEAAEDEEALEELEELESSAEEDFGGENSTEENSIEESAMEEDLVEAEEEILPEEADKEEEALEMEDALPEEMEMDNMLTDITTENEEEGEYNMDTQFMDTDFMDREKTALDETAVVTSGMKIKGDVESEGSLDVIGTIEGNIDILGKLNVTGNIQGNSRAAEVYAEGANITGEIISEGTIKIGQSSVIIGNLTATSAVVAGAVKGDIDVKGPVILDASAIVMGNIKSKSVQINNGAVIEGLCSQCYADVNPTSFFDDIKKAAKK